MLIGKNVTLRAIEPEDLESLRIWRNQPKLRQFFREFTEISKTEQLKWYETVVLSKKNTLMFAIVNKDSNTLLGACGLCYIDWLRKSADLSIYIGHEAIYLDKIYATDAARLLIEYGFKEIGLHRIWVEVYGHDVQKQDFFQSLGFHQEGNFKDAHWTDGKWVNSIFYGMLTHLK